MNAPVGLNSTVANYGFSTGNVLLDASVPIEGTHARIHVIGVGYLRTLDFFGRRQRSMFSFPCHGATSKASWKASSEHAHPPAWQIQRMRLAVNLFGSPALRPQEFANYAQRTIVGVSLQVAMPLGAYDEERYVNVGANRWSFRPEVALSHRRNRWLFEVAGGAWLFTENDDYVGHVSLTQRPLYFVKGNAIYTFRRNLWLSASYGYGGGGATTVGGLFRNNLQRNERVGIGLSLPSGRFGVGRGRVYERLGDPPRRRLRFDWRGLSVWLAIKVRCSGVRFWQAAGTRARRGRQTCPMLLAVKLNENNRIGTL